MVKTKEDRSNWVAVEPEPSVATTNTNTPIKPAKSAYAYFQKINGSSISRELSSSSGGGGPTDVGALGREVSARWQALSPTNRHQYAIMAEKDRARFDAESRRRDAEAMERRDRLQRERETLILDDGDGGDQVGGRGGRRTTRRARQKGQRKAEKKRAKKEEKKRMEGKTRIKGKTAKVVKTKKDEDDSDYDDAGDEDDSEDDSEAASSEESSKDDDNDDEDDESSSSSESSSSDDDDDDSDDSRRKTKPKRRPPTKVSQTVLDRRDRARVEKAEKEKYIESRQLHVREERAEQAQRRLEFLLKQSDIFRHFGNVKQEGTRLGAAAVAATACGGGNKTAVVIRGTDGDEGKEVEEVDEHEVTYLTTQPSTLRGEMRQYQLEGLNWMIRLQENGVNGILADEMGLGKTMQSISILVYMMEYKADTGPHLIIVPKSTLSNWMNELERWAPKLNVVKFHGTKEERADIAENVLQPGQRDEIRVWNVCVTTYEICNLDRNIFNKFAWSYLIIDEAHRLKNEASIFSKTVRTLETRFRLLLTGTPLQNNLHELWALLNYLVPDVFASAEQFDEWFNLDIDDADEKNKLILQLHKILRPFMLRRLKADVEKCLLPKSETILFTGMSAMQKKLYRDILMRDLDTLTGKSGGSRTAVLNIVMQLRKCAGHPYLFQGIEDRSLDPLGEHLVENCGKMVLLDKLLLRLKERGHRVLVFTQMTRILDILEDFMHMRSFQYCRIDGNTSYEDREERIDAYNKPDSEKFLFLLSTRAGGLGINLQTADVVILYDSDWNPQADLQAQDRAHRIGQKKPVQVFRLVTEDTIEQKIVERAQQKLKLDAMVVQQGRLKDKDTLSADELLNAVRFGADKIFKSKDSSITDDDIELILDYGMKKTQELNDKFSTANKGDLLDFKLDGGLSAQTFEGVDYSAPQSTQFAEELLSYIDVGKRERRTVAYNENQLHMQQMKQLGSQPKRDRVKKEIKLPKMLRLPKLEEWQLFDRDALYKLQELEEQAFRALSEEADRGSGCIPSKKADDVAEDDTAKNEEGEPKGETEDINEVKDVTGGQTKEFSLESLPPLLSEDQVEEKARLLAEGFADWSRHHFTAFVKASGKYGRSDYAKIANDVGKPLSAIKTYSEAFWDQNFGKKRFTENEYDRVVKNIEKGEKKIEDIKGLQRGTRILISLFNNPWWELQFTHVNTKDKKFTAEEDRYLLCWAHKYGYGQWEAIKFAIRRSAAFRFDYFLKSLPIDAIGRRCEQLMRFAEKEVEIMEKLAVEEAEKVGRKLPPGEIILPNFKELRARRRAEAETKFLNERALLERNVSDIDKQILQIQKQLRDIDGVLTIDSYFKKADKIENNSYRCDEPTKPHLEDVSKKRKASGGDSDSVREGKIAGAVGPDGDFVEFPDYDGEEEPHASKKAFTLFCKRTRKAVKNSLSPVERKDKDQVNGKLKDRWDSLTEDEKQVWKDWEVWDAKRYEHQLGTYESRHSSQGSQSLKKSKIAEDAVSIPKIPKKSGDHQRSDSQGSSFSIPKRI